MEQERNRIIFLNQMAGPLFRELAEDLAKVWPQSVLFTGHPDTVCCDVDPCLHIKPAPRYDRSSYFNRFVSWVKYFFKALWFVWRRPKNSTLFIVSNPPFLGLAGLFFKRVRRQRYVMLVYDVYPDFLVPLGRLKRGVISGCWDFFNRLVYENASLVITIDRDMGKRLGKKFDVSKTDGKKVVCIPPWADIEVIKPVDKKQNQFAAKYDLLDKTTILYSGNMGHSHDIETILNGAKKLKMEAGIHFLFIGEGAKWSLVEKTIEEFQLKNITLLPFQPEEVLPLSMTSGDIGIVTYEDGTQGCMSPSKAYYYMAAGLPILVISEYETDLTRLVKEKGCGIWVKNGDIDGMAKAVKELSENPGLLTRYKKAARK
ncbi:glycosyltransferase family 4 protein, partial [bacterium]|nr:glycosyltransferase family 4 protein [bacterium]